MQTRPHFFDINHIQFFTVQAFFGYNLYQVKKLNTAKKTGKACQIAVIKKMVALRNQKTTAV